ncbi:MAG TPA: hypothetical protein VIG24_07340 [Acidimicrobiia bacterium]
MSARLVSGSDTLTLDEANGWFVQSLDVGYPQVRAVVNPRADADGVYDSTLYFGARTVSLSLRAIGDRRASFESLSRFLRPSTRPVLFFTVDGTERRLRLRPSGRSAAFVGTPNSQEFLAQWVAPDGVIEAATETTATASAVPVGEIGRTYDLTFDRDYVGTSPVGSVTVTNAGTTVTNPVFQLYGPCTDPVIQNLTTGQELGFSITLAATQYLEVNTRDRTVRLNGLANQNRYNTLDFATSEWFGLAPGTTLLRYQPATFAAGAVAKVTFRSAWI